MSTVDVVVPATRPMMHLVMSLAQGSRTPDRIIAVGNEGVLEDGWDRVVDLYRFDSKTVPYGQGDAGLRRDIGAHLSTADIVVFLDDDLVAPRGMLEAAAGIAERDGWCWGHHRYTDFRPLVEAKAMGRLLDDNPELGRSRENGVNRWHGWYSSYAGLLAIRRDVFWEVGGFDLAFLGHHGNEDQHLGLRLSNRTGHPGQSYIHEPPFAWHPDVPLFHSQPASNIMGTHRLATVTVNGHDFAQCDSCPCRKPIDPSRLASQAEVTIPFDAGQISTWKES